MKRKPAAKGNTAIAAAASTRVIPSSSRRQLVIPPLQRRDDGRRGRVFTIRLSDAERGELEAYARADWAPSWVRGHYTRKKVHLGPFLVWCALQFARKQK